MLQSNTCFLYFILTGSKSQASCSTLWFSKLINPCMRPECVPSNSHMLNRLYKLSFLYDLCTTFFTALGINTASYKTKSKSLLQIIPHSLCYSEASVWSLLNSLSLAQNSK